MMLGLGTQFDDTKLVPQLNWYKIGPKIKFDDTRLVPETSLKLVLGRVLCETEFDTTY